MKTVTLTISRTFWNDHAERCGAHPGVRNEISAVLNRVTVELDDVALVDLLADAEYYADPIGFDQDLRGICRSAAATLAAIKKQLPPRNGAPRLDPAVARAAKEARAVEYLAIAASYVPEGYTVEYRKSLSGRHYGNRKLIQAPRPRTRKALYIFLHECAHAHLGHSHNGRKPRHVEEMEAEQWARERMREHGVPVPRSMVADGKRYVARKIKQAERRGAKKIDVRARRYAGFVP